MTKEKKPSTFMRRLGKQTRKEGKKYSVVMEMKIKGIINIPIPIALDVTASSQEEAKRQAIKFIAEQTDMEFKNIRRDDGLLAAMKRQGQSIKRVFKK